jgi:hypothetical protein
MKKFNRDVPLSPTPEPIMDRLEKKEGRLVSRGYKAVDEGREAKAERLLGRAARIQDKIIRKSN